MNQGQYDGSQVNSFTQGQPVGYYEQDTSNMGGVAPMSHMSLPLASGSTSNMGGVAPMSQMMVVTMMPQQAQPPPTMETPQDTGHTGNAWAALPQPGTHEQQAPPPGVPGRHSQNKAYKIVNPHTNEEVKGKGGGLDGRGVPGEAPNPAIQQQPVEAQAPQVQPQPQTQVGPQQPVPAAPMQSQQWPPTFAPQPNPQTNMQPSPAAASSPPQPTKKKGLVNKKMDKIKAPEGPAPTPAPAPTPPPDPVEPPKPSTPAPVPAAPVQEPAPRRSAAESLGTPAAAAQAAAAATGMTQPSGNTGLPKWPPSNALSAGSSSFASSIKALNLEPMRAGPSPYRAKLQRTHPELQHPTQQTPAAPHFPTAPAPHQAPSVAASPQPAAVLPSQPLHSPQPPVTGPPPSTVPASQPSPQPTSTTPVIQKRTAKKITNMSLAKQPAKQKSEEESAADAANKAEPDKVAHAPADMPPKEESAAPPAERSSAEMASPEAPRREPTSNAATPQVPHVQPRSSAALPPATSADVDQVSKRTEPEPAQAEESKFEDRPIGTSGMTSPADVRNEDNATPVSPIPTPVPANFVKRLCLIPDDGIFDRTLMLRIWKIHKDEMHQAVRTLNTHVRPGGAQGTPNRPKATRPRNDPVPEPEETQLPIRDRKLKGQLKPYVPRQPTTKEAEIERRVRGLLNRITPDNLKTIVERLALISLDKAEELELVIRIIFQKALTEPFYCETYADMVFSLRSRYPEFPPEHEGEKAHTFTRVLLNTCQNEFETLPNSFEPTDEERQKYNEEDLALEMKNRRDKALANMKFIGNLFLRQLLAVKVIGQVVHDLIGIKDSLPEEHMIECVCVLLQAIGHTLDGTSHGKMLMSQFSGRLIELKNMPGSDGKVAFSKRIQFQIQNLLDLRSNGWQKKLFTMQAKTKSQIRKDAQTDAQRAAKGGADAMFATGVAGQRPSYIDDFRNVRPPRGQAKVEAPRPNWDQAYVRKVFQYFAEEKNADGLEKDWKDGCPNKEGQQQGVTWLLEIGFQEGNKEDVLAETVTMLVSRGAVTWEVLRDALAPFLEGLEDMKMDFPMADVFFHSLLSRLLTTCGKEFSCSIMKPVPMEGDFAWSLILGALKKVKERKGSDAVRKTLDIEGFLPLAAKSRKCNSSELKRYLQEEGLM